jgi:hypothetical protein
MACALDGLAYANATLFIFKLLRDKGVLAWALEHDLRGQSREKIVERIVLAYIWGEETLETPLMQTVLSKGTIDDLNTAVAWLWGVSGEKLEDQQVERVLSLWAAITDRVDARGEAATELRSNMSRLATYIKVIGPRERRLLLSVAPFVQANYNGHEFVEALARLADVDIHVVGEALGEMIKGAPPTFDLDNKLKSLLRRLGAGGLRPQAIAYAEKLREYIPGMPELYLELVNDA